MTSTLISGFDSAWTPQNRGAIGHCIVDSGRAEFVAPFPANFDEALASIEQRAIGTQLQLIGIDQPLIVPNQTGGRPVERVVGSLVSKLKGGMQPANRGKESMFGDSAPIWPFLENLNAICDPVAAIRASSGRFAFEIYPCAALLGLCPGFMDRGCVAKYNPTIKKKFRRDDWQRICTCLATMGNELGIEGLAAWSTTHAAIAPLRKHHQDELDAAICVVITYLWRRFGFERSLLVGDLATGYIVTPTHPEMTQFLVARAAHCSVPIQFDDSLLATGSAVT